jgi:mono/diheme cytochrome c family protein
MRMQNLLTGVLGLLLLSCSVSAVAQQAQIGKFTGHANSGKELYQRYCIFCHGVYGDGRGENAPYLDPKPRDFTQATYKCRSTPTGTLPLDSDLFDTITRGVHASGMPSWEPLTGQQRANLVAYVKTFSSRFTEEKPSGRVPIPPEPPNSADSIKRGGDLFQSMNCWLCHGKEGRGNGPSAVSLTDTKGYPITPFDFTSGPRFKCGSSNQELFRDLVTGLDGTPMPSFTDTLKPDQIWDIVHFVKTLANGRKVQLSQSEPKGN